MAKKKKIEEQVTDNESEILTQEEEHVQNFLVKNKNTIKDLIAPAGINAANLNHLEIISNTFEYVDEHKAL